MQIGRLLVALEAWALYVVVLLALVVITAVLRAWLRRWARRQQLKRLMGDADDVIAAARKTKAK